MKNKFCVAVVLGILTLLLLTAAMADTTSDGYEYTVSDGKAIITGYTGTATVISFPSTLGGYPVGAIGDSAFEDNENLTNVTMPDGVVSIGDSAFEECSSLTNITIPSSVTSIGSYAFSLCSKLTSITIPNGVTRINFLTFQHCSSLSSITIPANVTSIEFLAFYGCSGLTSVTIPAKVTSIDMNPFSCCSNLTNISVASGNTTYKSSNGILYDKIMGLLIAYPAGKNSSSFSIPSSVTSIGNEAFGGSYHLTSVTIPNSVTSIGHDAFSGCFNLSNILIPNSVTSIGDFAFTGCESLTSISVASGNTAYASASGILYNKSMKTLLAYPPGKSSSIFLVPSSVTKIGDTAFNLCSSLTSITLPNSVTSIGEWSFECCWNLTSIMIPASVTSIGEWAFSGCDDLTIHGYAGSYAQTYAQANSIPFKATEPKELTITGITANKTTATVGTAITWTTTAAGGSGAKTYRFLLYKDGKLLTSSNYAAAATYKYTPTEAGTYKVRAYVKDSTGTVAMNSANVIVIEPLAITSVKADKTSATAGTAITWTTTAEGGSGTKTYRFLLYKDGDLLTSSKFTTTATYKYTPTEAGTYRVRAYVKDSTGTVAMNSADVIVKAPLAIISVKANKTSATVGTAITWTTAATGGSGTKTYRFLLYKDGKLLTSSKFATAATYKYTPTVAGTYKVRAYVKDSIGTVAMNSANVVITKMVKALAITSVTANRTSAAVGDAITWTTTATGGSGTKTYRFLLYKDGKLLASSNFTTAATYKYTPTEVGTYKVRAYVKDSNGTVAMNSGNVTVK